MKLRLRKPVKVIILIFILLSLLLVGNSFLNREEIVVIQREHISLIKTDEIVLNEKVEPFYKWSKEEWTALHDINNDYVCTIRFESGIIDLPVTQAYDNDYYLRTNFETKEYDEFGTPFIDYEIDYKDGEGIYEDNNITIYGHYCYPEYDPEQVKMFTPLHLLKEESNYEDNKYIQLLFEDEVRRYEVCEVFYCELVGDGTYYYTRDDMEYYRPSFTKEYLDNFKERINEREFYDTGIDFDENSKLLTLQTCVQNHNELRLIVIAKEITRVDISE